METEKDLFDRIMDLPILRIFRPFYQKHKEVLLYLFFGFVTTVISVVVYWLGADVAGISPLIANLFSWVLAVLVAFLTNRTWVFHARTENRQAFFRQLLSFYGGRLFTLGVEEAILFVGISLLHFANMPVKWTAQVVIVILNYVISKLVVFKKKS